MAEHQWEAGVITYPLQVELFHPTYSWIRGPLCRGTIFSDDDSVPVFFFPWKHGDCLFCRKYEGNIVVYKGFWGVNSARNSARSDVYGWTGRNDTNAESLLRCFCWNWHSFLTTLNNTMAWTATDLVETPSNPRLLWPCSLDSAFGNIPGGVVVGVGTGVLQIHSLKLTTTP